MLRKYKMDISLQGHKRIVIVFTITKHTCKIVQTIGAQFLNTSQCKKWVHYQKHIYILNYI